MSKHIAAKPWSATGKMAKRHGLSRRAINRLGGAETLVRMSPEAQALMLGLANRSPASGLPKRTSALTVKRSTADWLEAFARADMSEIIKPKHGRPRMPMREPAVRVPMTDYRHFRGDPRAWQMMELSRRVGYHSAATKEVAA